MNVSSYSESASRSTDSYDESRATADASRELVAEASKKPSKEGAHDLLSFMFLVFRTISEEPTLIEYLLGTVLDDLVIRLPDEIAKGKFFSITLVGKQDILDYTGYPYPDDAPPFPDLVAIKSPLLQRDDISLRNGKVFSSMVMELNILKEASLKRHDNVVTLLGICWQSWRPQSDLITPSLVLEAAGLGDLESLLRRKETLGLDKRLLLCKDVLYGVKAIHALGIIHCDIKPKNILVFHRDDHLVAKIADFGSSRLLVDIDSPTRLPGGTILFRAPERDEVLPPELIMQTDIFSLGMALWVILKGPIVLDALANLGQHQLSEIKRNNTLAFLAAKTLDFENIESYLWGDGQDPDPDQFTHLSRSLLLGTMTTIPNRMTTAQVVLYHFGWVLFAKQLRGYLQLHHLLPALGMALAPKVESKITSAFLHIWESNQMPHHKAAVGAMLRLNTDSESLMEVLNYMGIVSLLPISAQYQLAKQCSIIASDASQSSTRRAKAALQCAVLNLRAIQDERVQAENIDTALSHLRKAAVLGESDARAMVGWFYDTFKRDCPIDRDTELRWAYDGASRGSMTAMKRLQQLAPQKASEASIALRFEYMGLGGFTKRTISDREAEDHVSSILAKPSRNLTPHHFHLLMAGRLLSLQKIMSRWRVDVNQHMNHRLTPLLISCQCGHTDFTLFLLKIGATASIATERNANPLHFLSSFPEADIPKVAELLLRSGAELEAKSRACGLYTSCIDSKYGHRDGTPLFWAVVAENKTAVRALLTFGADPFDEAGQRSVPAGSRSSPIDQAAEMHQYEILEIMLSSRPRSEISRKLNGRSSTVWARQFEVLPIFWAIQHFTCGSFWRMLCHGNKYRLACKRTLDLLVEYGASVDDLFKMNTRPEMAFTRVFDDGPSFLLHHLLVSGYGKLFPNFEAWCESVVHAVGRSDRIKLDLLIGKHGHLKGETRIDINLLKRIVQYTDNVEFVDRIVSSVPGNWGNIPLRPVFTEAFEVAINAGHLQAARYLYKAGYCDIIHRDPKDGSTILGRLIRDSTRHRNQGKKIHFLLSIGGSCDDVFWDVLELNGAKATALHCAVWCVEFHSKYKTRNDHIVLEEVLRQFHSFEHLNALSAGVGELAGTAPLHLAVRMGNVMAVKTLLQEENMDINLLTNEGESAVDMCYRRRTFLKSELEALDTEPHYWEQASTAYYNVTKQLLGMLLAHGGQPHKDSVSVTKTKNSKLHIIYTYPTRSIVTLPYKETEWSGDQPVVALVRGLAVGDSLVLDAVMSNLLEPAIALIARKKDPTSIFQATASYLEYKAILSHVVSADMEEDGYHQSEDSM